MFYYFIGMIFAVLAAGAVDGDASLSTLSICTVVSILFLGLGTYKMHRDEQDF